MGGMWPHTGPPPTQLRVGLDWGGGAALWVWLQRGGGASSPDPPPPHPALPSPQSGSGSPGGGSGGGGGGGVPGGGGLSPAEVAELFQRLAQSQQERWLLEEKVLGGDWEGLGWGRGYHR